MDCTADETRVRSLSTALQQVPDCRVKRGRHYEAALVLTLMVLAKLAGKKSLSGIARRERHVSHK